MHGSPRTPRITTYLNAFQYDVRQVWTDLHRRQVARLYHSEPWMGLWRCYYDDETGAVYAVRIHQRTKLLQFAFPNNTNLKVQASIRERSTIHTAAA